MTIKLSDQILEQLAKGSIHPAMKAQVQSMAKEVISSREVLQDIAGMPEYDQDDSHRLRHKARKALESVQFRDV